MMNLTNQLSTDVHHIFIDDESVTVQITPQIISTLRRELVLWKNHTPSSINHRNEVSANCIYEEIIISTLHQNFKIQILINLSSVEVNFFIKRKFYESLK